MSRLQCWLFIVAVASLSAIGAALGSGCHPVPLTVTVSPATASVATGGTLQFTAKVTGTSNTAVTWSLSGAGCSGAACGTRDSTTANPVTYTAPGTVPSPNTVTLTASLQADPTTSGSATITITGPANNNSKLTGQYAFLFQGFDADGQFAMAGTFTADGNGNITTGVEDINRVSGVTQNLSLTGTYSTGTDNQIGRASCRERV